MVQRARHIAKGYLIDPEAKKITHVNHDTKDYKQIYDLIDCKPSPFVIVHLDDENIIFIDDEGLLKNPRYFFNIKGYPQPLAGKGLVLGCDSDGDTVSATIEYEDLKKLITYSEHKFHGAVVEDIENADLSKHSALFREGERGFVHKQTPVFGPPEDDDEKETA